jgi:hypothetical protein
MERSDLRLDPAMSPVLPIIDQVFRQYAPRGFKVEYTAGKEWFHHGLWSLHHSGNAVDIRTRTLPDGGVGAISSMIATVLQESLNSRLGRNKYRVLYNDQGPAIPHIHIQYNSGGRWSEPGDFGTGQGSTLA